MIWRVAKPIPPNTPPQFLRSIDYPDGDRKNLKVTYTSNIFEAKVYIDPREAQIDSSNTGCIPLFYN